MNVRCIINFYFDNVLFIVYININDVINIECIVVNVVEIVIEICI